MSVEHTGRCFADQRETRPVDRLRLVAELLEEVKFGLAEGGAFVGTGGEVLVETLHESDGEDIVGGPEAGNDGFGAGEEECAFETGDAFGTQKLSRAGFAG